ncbi:MAG TPA: SDR family NAD(P)-dependent oxidoreductase [Gaiellaceae bacterium]|nr:SDR family NAD(P)-dependent oxidoreductase [Gaiellaceae bacterium]
MRVAVVTGASSGIGAALCRELRSRGWRTVGLSRRPAPDADEHEPCDVADRAAVEAAAERVLARHPRIELLVNNAGVPGRVGYLDAGPEQLEELVATNYLGSVWCLRAFLPGLGAGAAVVNVASVAGVVAAGPYSASKHAQLAFSRSVAIELAPRGVHVLSVLPGYVETPGFPQRRRLGFPLRLVVVDPTLVARRTLDALERRRREIVVPRWYRPAGWLQALAPGLLTRRPASLEPGRARSGSRARR